MLPALRQARIIELLRRDGAAGLKEMSAALGVSVSTLRRDVDMLFEAGHLERTRGGALLTGSLRAGPELGRAIASELESGAKAAIGREAAQLIRPGMTAIFDSGSTTASAARAARDSGTAFTAVTNDLAIAATLAEAPQIRLIVAGGELRPGSGTLMGADTLDLMRRLRADLAFVGAHAVSETEMSDTSVELAQLKRVILAAADRPVLLADSSKIFSRAFCSFGLLRQLDRLVTDDRLGLDQLAVLQHAIPQVDLAALP